MNRVFDEMRWTSRWFRAMRQHRFDILLASLLALMVTAPLLHIVWPLGRPFVAHLIMLLVFGLMLLSAVLAACVEKKEIYVALGLAVPGFLLDAVGVLAGLTGLAVAGHLFETVFMVYTVVLVLRLIFAARRVTSNVIWAALCVYLLLGVLWANVFSLLDTIQPGSFHFSFVEGNQQELMRLGGSNSIYPLYYSLVTMTTLGYGDIVPITVATRMLAAVEALTGQLYLAVLVARLVGMHASRSAAEEEPQPVPEDQPL